MHASQNLKLTCTPTPYKSRSTSIKILMAMRPNCLLKPTLKLSSSSCRVFIALHGPAVTCQIWQIGTASSFQAGRELDSFLVGWWCESQLHSAFGFPLLLRTHRVKLQVSVSGFLSRIWRGQRSSLCWSQRHEAWWCRPIPSAGSCLPASAVEQKSPEMRMQWA